MFAIDIDDFAEEIWHEIGRVADDSGNHKAIFKSDDMEDVIAGISDRLRPFFEAQLYECDEQGYPEDE